MRQELWHSIRALAKRPGFAALAILTIALGIGLNTTMFTIVNDVLWKPFPFAEADRLVRFNEDSPSGGLNNSGPNSADWKSRSNVLEDVATYRFFPPLILRLPERDQSTTVAYAHPNLFSVLRVSAAEGRLFNDQDDKSGSALAAVITDAAWKKYFGGDPGVIGKPQRVATAGAETMTVVGVLPPGFEYDTVEFWVPLGRNPLEPDTMRANHWFAAVGRLNPGVSLDQAQRELSAVSIGLEKEYPGTNKGIRAVVKSLADYYAGRIKTPLLILFWAVVFVMLIASGNVVHLVLTRTLSRGRELAVRLAIGASSRRLIWLLLSEGLVLAAAGGAVGVLAAQWAVTAIVAAQPGLLPSNRAVSLDAEALGFAVGATLFTALILAVIPVWRVSRVSVLDALQAAGRGSGDGRRQRFGWVMIAGEIAMAAVLLAGAGLMVQTLRNLSRVDIGYDAGGLLSLSFSPPAGKQYTDESAQALIDRINDAARSLPGFQSVAMAVPFGVGGNGMLGPVVIPGRTNPSTPPLTPAMNVSPSFFETMRIPFVKGRTFSEKQGEVREAIVNEEFVRRFLPDENPLGRRISVWSPAVIVGVVHNSRLQGNLAEVKPEVYLPGLNAGSAPTLLVRVQGKPEGVANGLRDLIKNAESGLRVGAVRTMEGREATRTVVERFTRALLLVFAFLATVLACLGVYGVASYNVAQRTREIGIRMALGATRSNVAGLVFRQTILATAIGMIAGIAGATALSRFVRSQLYGVTPYDGTMLAGVMITLALVAVIASAVPLQRASRVDPAISLRQE